MVYTNGACEKFPNKTREYMKNFDKFGGFTNNQVNTINFMLHTVTEDLDYALVVLFPDVIFLIYYDISSEETKQYMLQRWILEGAPFFCNHLFFCNHFEELKTVFIEVKLIINNGPLTYVYPNTIKTYLIPNHLLFGRQLLCYSNTTSAVIRNLTVLSSTTDKINRISNHFWHRWRHEYVVNLRETQRASKLNINSQKLCCASL